MLLRPGKEGRRTEPAALAATLEAAGVPVAGELDGSALVPVRFVVSVNGVLLVVDPPTGLLD